MSPPPRTMCAWQVGPRGRIHSPVLCSSRCCRHAGMMTTLSLNADRSPFAPPPHLTGRETKAREWGVSPCEGLEPGLSESSTYAPQHDVAPPHRWGVKSRVLPWGGAWRGGPGPHPACSAIFHKLSLPTLCVQVWPWGFPTWDLMGRGNLRMETVGAQSGGMGG